MNPLPDRELLRANATANQRKTRKFILVVLTVLSVAAVSSTFVFSEPHRLSVPGVAVTALPVLVLAGVALVAIRTWSRHDSEPQLSFGADREVQRAVARALRDGGTADPRIDALARDAAERGRRQQGLIRLHAVLAMVFAVLFLRYAVEGDGWFIVAIFGLLTATQILMVHTCWRVRRRAARYLEGAGRGLQP
jgi:membrane protein YdbS with pleckstrin-like domain